MTLAAASSSSTTGSVASMPASTASAAMAVRAALCGVVTPTLPPIHRRERHAKALGKLLLRQVQPSRGWPAGLEGYSVGLLYLSWSRM